jgi:hypothetical protein
MLEVIIERLEGSTQLRSAVRHVMQDSDDALSAFKQLAADEPAVANQVLFSAAARSAASRIRATWTSVNPASVRRTVNSKIHSD